MKKIILITCCKEKMDHPVPAEQLYIGNDFKRTLQYAKMSNPDGIYILSGKHGLVMCDEIIAPYDLNLCIQCEEYQNEWYARVLDKLSTVSDLENDSFEIFAVKEYYKGLLPSLPHGVVPLEGMSHEEVDAWFFEHGIN